MQILLAAGLVSMAVLAVFYLRQRKLAFWRYVAWALIAILLPLIGPFLVIYLKPEGRDVRKIG